MPAAPGITGNPLWPNVLIRNNLFSNQLSIEKELPMNFRCLPEKLSKLTLSVLFSLFGLAAVVMGFTVLPVFGFILSIPFFILAFYFYKAHLNSKCEITR